MNEATKELGSSFYAFVATIICLSYCCYNAYLSYDLWENGVSTIGTVSTTFSEFGENQGCRDSRHGQTRECKTIFVDVGHKYRDAEVSVSRSYSIGERVKITYMPLDINNNMLQTLDFKGNPFLRFLISLVILASGLTLFRKKFNREVDGNS